MTKDVIGVKLLMLQLSLKTDTLYNEQFTLAQRDQNSKKLYFRNADTQLCMSFWFPY